MESENYDVQLMNEEYILNPQSAVENFLIEDGTIKVNEADNGDTLLGAIIQEGIPIDFALASLSLGKVFTPVSMTPQLI